MIRFIIHQKQRSTDGKIAASTISNYYKAAKLFCEMLEPLKDKMLALLIQLSPSYQIKEGLQDFILLGVNKFYTPSR
jgi:uncharacterized protein YecE (DUF72 family)